MRRRVSGCAVLVVAACAALAACSSSGSSGGGAGASPGGSKTITIGVVTDLTGPASSGFTTDLKGIDAYLNRVNADGGVDGYKIRYVVGDTTSTPTGALAAVQQLVQNDNVFAILENSSVFYGAETYALQAGIPVVGTAIDGPIWSDPKDTNLFSSIGVVNADYIQLYFGRFMKAQGVTKCGAIGYSGSASAASGAAGFIKSCEEAGLTSGYLNNQVPFGSTNVGPIALALKSSGTDGVFVAVDPATGFALAAALHQLGAKLKVILLPTGYGGDLLADKAAVEAAQGVDFTNFSAPAEQDTPATRQRAADLAKVGVTGPPTFAEQGAYLTMAAFVDGLKAAGANPTRASFMSAMSGIKNYNGDGLLAPEVISFRDYAPASGCTWIAQLEGAKFAVVSGSPFCGPTMKITG